jgi:hypothetical protein
LMMSGALAPIISKRALPGSRFLDRQPSGQSERVELSGMLN